MTLAQELRNRRPAIAECDPICNCNYCLMDKAASDIEKLEAIRNANSFEVVGPGTKFVDKDGCMYRKEVYWIMVDGIGASGITFDEALEELIKYINFQKEE